MMKISGEELKQMIIEESAKQRNNQFLEFENQNFEIDELDEEDCFNEDENKKTFFYNVCYVFMGTAESRAAILKNLLLEIDKLSWMLFEENKIYGANCINIFSPKVASIFDMVNILTDNVKFNSSDNYSDKTSYLIGELNNRYKVFLPKETTRTVISEKVGHCNENAENFISKKYNIIEIYNSEIPENKFTIKLENIQP